MIPVVASNRYGTEILLNKDGSERQRVTFYGRSFITDETGAKVAEVAETDVADSITVLTSTINPEANRIAFSSGMQLQHICAHCCACGVRDHADRDQAFVVHRASE